MKLSSLSTLFDYIPRAMPWTAQNSLSVDEVYASTAYLLHLCDVLPADFTLSDRNFAEAQQCLPNRNGMTTAHAMWPSSRASIRASRPDVQGSAGMSGCATDAKIASMLRDFACSDAVDFLAGRIRQGGVGVWGRVPMPAQAIAEADALVIARWLAAGAP